MSIAQTPNLFENLPYEGWPLYHISHEEARAAHLLAATDDEPPPVAESSALPGRFSGASGPHPARTACAAILGDGCNTRPAASSRLFIVGGARYGNEYCTFPFID
jgi:hypothetical protein